MNNYIYGLGCFLCLPKVLLDSNPRDSNTLPKMVVHLLLTFNLMDASHFFCLRFSISFLISYPENYIC